MPVLITSSLRRSCRHWRIAEHVYGTRDLQERRAEIMTPLRNAMRLVDHEQIDPVLLQDL
jgi:hypothetical protein